MSEPNGYLIHGTAFSSKEAAFKALVSNHEQESWFHKIWWEDAQPYYFESQPQLTIPAWVAKYQEALEWADDYHFPDEVNPYREEGDEDRFWKWRRIGDNNLIYRIYKACREMEADIQLVKVVE